MADDQASFPDPENPQCATSVSRRVERERNRFSPVQIRLRDSRKFRMFPKSRSGGGKEASRNKGRSRRKKTFQLLLLRRDGKDIESVFDLLLQIRKFRAGARCQESAGRKRFCFRKGDIQFFQEFFSLGSAPVAARPRRVCFL